MRGKIIKQFVSLIGSLILWFACSHQSPDHTAQKEYREAVHLAEERVRENPDNVDAVRELGVLYFKSGQVEKAIPILEKAEQLKTNDPRTSCYLGLSYEMSGQLDPALAIFLRYLQLPEGSLYRKWLRGRHDLLMRKKMKNEIAALVLTEAETDTNLTNKKTVLVLPFSYHGKDTKYAFLGIGLQDLIINDLHLVEGIEIVDRFRLQLLLDEIAQKESLLQKVEHRTAWIGKKMNARTILKGAYNIVDDQQIILDIAYWDITSEELPHTITVPDSLANFFKLQKDIVFNLLKAIDVNVPSELSDRISRNKVSSLSALIAFSAGLSKEDAGEYREALIFYRKALDLAPDFKKSIEKMETTACLAMALRDPDRAVEDENFADMN